METIKVYVKTDNIGRITAVQSSIFLTDTTGWTQIDEGNGDKYAHAQSGYFEKPIINFDGSHNYKLVDGLAVETTAMEQAAELTEKPPTPPSPLDVLGAQVAQLSIENMKKDQMINALGAQLAQTSLDVIALKLNAGGV